LSCYRHHTASNNRKLVDTHTNLVKSAQWKKQYLNKLLQITDNIDIIIICLVLLLKPRPQTHSNRWIIPTGVITFLCLRA